MLLSSSSSVGLPILSRGRRFEMESSPSIRLSILIPFISHLSVLVSLAIACVAIEPLILQIH